MKKNNIVLSPSCEFSRRGLTINSDISFDGWLEIGNNLKLINKSIHFCIGDWLNFGEAKFGEMYAQAMDETGYDYQTLANDKWVSRRVDFSRRRENLSFEFHKIVASLEPEDQDLMLDKAEETKMDRTKFRRLVYQYNLRMEVPELTQAQIDKAFGKQPDFDLVQRAVTAGATLLDELDHLELEKLEVNARDYLLSLLRDVVGRGGNILVKYGKSRKIHDPVESEEPEQEEAAAAEVVLPPKGNN